MLYLDFLYFFYFQTSCLLLQRLTTCRLMIKIVMMQQSMYYVSFPLSDTHTQRHAHTHTQTCTHITELEQNVYNKSNKDSVPL